MLSFQRATGAAADSREIEYVSAIHQASPRPRPEGSIKATDVSHFLLSRYGILVPEAEVRETIIKGYGGGDAEEECIDLTELTATILIPYIFKATKHRMSGRHVQKDDDSKGEGSSSGGKDPAIGEVLKMILGDVTGSTAPTTIDQGLIQRILMTYGEAELAQDSALIHEMLVAATGGQEDVVLDEKTFAKAIAGDIQNYNVDSETDVTSNYTDVFPPEEEFPQSGSEERSRNATAPFSADEESPGSLRSKETNRPEEARTANGIDFISDTHRSKLFTVFLWAFFIMTQHTYLPDPTGDLNPENCEDADFVCIVGRRIIRWVLITLFYTIGGTLFITIGSWGNSFEARSWSAWPAIASILFMLAAAIVPVAIVTNDGENQDKSEEYLSFITFAFGIIVVILQVIYLLGRYSKYRTNIINSRGVKRIFAALQTGNILTESYVKEAAAKKTQLIVSNAIDVHGPADEVDFGRDKSYSHALLNYGKRGESYETCGGFRWTWHHILSWKLSKVEGVLIPSKLLTANLLQLIMTVFVTVLLVISTETAADAVRENIRQRDPAGLIFSDLELENLTGAIKLSGKLGAVLSLVACIALTLAYLPSIVRTTLQFRCGAIASLGNDNFFKYAVAPDSVSKVPGSMFWAIFFAGVAVCVVCGVITFFFAFEATRNFAYSVLAQIFGFLIPTIFKLIVLVCLRNRFYAGQYRRKPVSANFLGLALQCLDYGLAYGYMLFRAVKLILVPVYYIGRVDTPLFAPKVGSIGALDLDDSPVHFRKLIISHEAHRHPYIEILGKMYLLKLRYRDDFGTTSGSRWRMIFVSALMPWMRRHRVMFDTDASATNESSFAAVVEMPMPLRSGAELSLQKSEQVGSEDIQQTSTAVVLSDEGADETDAAEQCSENHSDEDSVDESTIKRRP